ncbi:sulfotransferase domain-containing protein [Vibrio coralliirubri]|uniref:sulfotransferase domain-containing protein n=1 Tax=Vibrio coralliirubri TaxID=1516159 RepID=UPI000632D414|nr:sulfotransferase domain-containing protein [Vibrio coralliirubri]CDU13615.1 hypothetical protein VCR17J2_50022 [Vibrio coralliirubri]
MENRLPNVLVVGSMKCGSTSLCRDLSAYDDIYTSENKEPNVLLDITSHDELRERYETVNVDYNGEKIIIDGSTDYSKLDFSSIAAMNAESFLGNNIKIIYIIRNPVKRVISHHKYMHIRYAIGTNDVNKDIYDNNNLTDYGLYFEQIKPWIETFGLERVKIVTLDRYSNDQVGVINELRAFLDLPKRDTIKPKINNQTHSLKVIPVRLQKWTDSKFYVIYLRPWLHKIGLGKQLERVRSALRKKKQINFLKLNDESERFIVAKVKKDNLKLRTMVLDEDYLFIRAWFR